MPGVPREFDLRDRTVDAFDIPHLGGRYQAVFPGDLPAECFDIGRQDIEPELFVFEFRVQELCFHPEKIPEGDEGSEVKIMKDGQVLRHIDHLFLRGFLKPAKLPVKPLQVFVVAKLLITDMNVLEQHISCLSPDQGVERDMKMTAELSRFIHHQRGFPPDPPVSAVDTNMEQPGNDLCKIGLRR